jgi:hypothetical protein
MADDNGGEIDAVVFRRESAVEEEQLQAAHVLQSLVHIVPHVLIGTRHRRRQANILPVQLQDQIGASENATQIG